MNQESTDKEHKGKLLKRAYISLSTHWIGRYELILAGIVLVIYLLIRSDQNAYFDYFQKDADFFNRISRYATKNKDLLSNLILIFGGLGGLFLTVWQITTQLNKNHKNSLELEDKKHDQNLRLERGKLEGALALEEKKHLQNIALEKEKQQSTLALEKEKHELTIQLELKKIKISYSQDQIKDLHSFLHTIRNPDLIYEAKEECRKFIDDIRDAKKASKEGNQTSIEFTQIQELFENNQKSNDLFFQRLKPLEKLHQKRFKAAAGIYEVFVRNEQIFAQHLEKCTDFLHHNHEIYMALHHLEATRRAAIQSNKMFEFASMGAVKNVLSKLDEVEAGLDKISTLFSDSQLKANLFYQDFVKTAKPWLLAEAQLAADEAKSEDSEEETSEKAN